MEGKSRFFDRTNLVICLLIGLFGLILFFYFYSSEEGHGDQAVGKIVRQTGGVQIRRAKFENWKYADPDAALFNRSAIYTTPGSDANLRLHGVDVHIDEKTLLQIIEPEKKNEMWMDFGSFVISAKENKNLTLKVGGKIIHLELQNGSARIGRSKEGLTEIQSLNGRLNLEIDGKTQALTPESSVRFMLPGGNSEFSEEMLAQERRPAEAQKIETLSPIITTAPSPHVTPAKACVAEENLKSKSESALESPTLQKPSSMPTPAPSSLQTPAKTKKTRRLDPFSFQLGVGGNYISAKESSDNSSSELRGFSGPTWYLQGWTSLGENLGVDISYLSVQSKAEASLYGEHAKADVSWSTATLGVFSKKTSGFPLLRAGLHRQEVPLFFETDTHIKVDRATIYSGYLGYGKIFDLREDLFFLWDSKIIIPFSASSSGSTNSFQPGIGLDTSVGIYKCLNPKWSIGFNVFAQYQPAKYQAPFGPTLTPTSYSSELINVNNQVRLIYGACGFY